MIPLEDGMHYHCCFDTTGYYCTSDEQLHLVDCEYTCTYDADEDAIYCAPDPENPNDEPEPIPSGQPF